MKKILGLDIGTNSIGGALIQIDTENFGNNGKIDWLGSRIIPVEGDVLRKFESGGQVETKAAKRRQKRGSRRLKHRYKLRRTRLIQVLKLLGWIPENFPTDFKKEKKKGIEFKMKDYLPFSETTIREAAKAFMIEPNKKGEINVPDDWIVYYLRRKALSEKIELSELARILYMMNQRRGFKSSRKDLQEDTIIIAYNEFNQKIRNGEYVDSEGKTLETKFVETTRIRKVIWVEDEEKDRNGNYTYKIIPESDRMKPWVEKRKKKPNWEGEEFKFLVTLKTKKSGKEHKVEQLKPQIPEEKDWNLAMVSLDEEIENSGRQVGEFFFDKLVEDKNYRIRQQVVKRERYQSELIAIWQKQSEFHSELGNKEKLEEIAHLLYPLQSKQKLAKWKQITNGTLLDVIANDIIYYQRDLKSQKHLIDKCRYEKKTFSCEDQDGKEITVTEGYRVAPKSCPEFQEFRIWQDIHNMRIYLKEDEETGKVDVDLSHLLTYKKKAELFELMDGREEVKESQLLKTINRSFSAKTHRINLFANRKILKGNETKALFRKVFKEYGFDGEHLLQDKDKFQLLWHIIYSITGKNHEKGIKRALTNKKNKFYLPEKVVNHLAEETKEFPKQYAAYSRKAIKKLLPLMRSGQYWNEDNIQIEIRERIDKFIDGEYDEAIDIKNRERIAAYGLDEIKKFQGFPVWLACYVVYGRHSERESDKKYDSWNEMDALKLVPPNSLRNPIVEQVVRETIQVVKEVWEKYGRPDEIHIEMGRDLKKNADERKRISEMQIKNFNEKQRIKKLLQELKEGNPESPIDIEKFRLWKGNGGWEADIKFNELFNKSNEFVSNADIEKYRLWAEQNHRSPYTGKSIPLSKLFTEEYEKEHIIPRSKLKYDAMTNLVICEAAVNKFKGDRLALEMINTDGGRKHTYNGRTFELLSKEAYINNCKKFNKAKRKNLLAEEVPEDFIERQINDTRHITRKLAELLWPVANDKEGVVFTVGQITDELKQKWGIKAIWKELIKYRFERLGDILGKQFIKPDDKDPNKFHFILPDEKVQLKRIDHRHHAMDALVVAATQRAHIKYLNSLNSLKERGKWRYLIAKKYREGNETSRTRDFIAPWPDFTEQAKEKLSEIIVSHKYNNRVIRTPNNRYWKWEQQTDGSWRKVLRKQQPNERWKTIKLAMFNENPQGAIYVKEPKDERVLKAVEVQIERAKGIKDKNGKPRDYIYDKHARKQIIGLVKQFNGDIGAIKAHLKRNPLKDRKGRTVSKVPIARFSEVATIQTKVDKSFTHKKINKIPYAKRTIERWEQWQTDGVRKIKGVEVQFPTDTTKWPIAFLLKKHLAEYTDEKGKPDPNAAFTGEGLEELFKKAGRSIKKVSTYEPKSNPIKLYDGIWETAQGGNIYFVIQENIETKKRDYYTPPIYSSENVKDLKDYGIINRLLNNMDIADERKGWRNIVLKVGDLVYVPTPDEIEHYKENNINWIEDIDWNREDKKRVFEQMYVVRKFTGSSCYFLPHNVASLLKKYDKDSGKGEFGSQNLSEKNLNERTTIKDYCIPIEVDRLGNVIKVDGWEINTIG